jgi:hypothetical protein
LGWDRYLSDQWGHVEYSELRQRAQSFAKPDLAETVAALRAELEAFN